MIRLVKVFLGMLLCIFFLFAYSHASDENLQQQKKIFWKETDSIKVAWDGVTTHEGGSTITKNEGEIKYLLYVKEQDTNKSWPVKKWVEGKKDPVSETDPISETSCEIKFEVESGYKVGKKYLIGVSTGIYKDKKSISTSDISWSCEENCTSNNPFGVIFTKK